jgi:hypothetical protein
MASAPAPKAPESTVTIEQLAAAEKLRLETEKASQEAADAAAALAAMQPPVEPKPLKKVLVTAKIADQVNPLTNERIAHAGHTLVDFDRWIEIQIEAGVLSLVEM